MFRNVSFRIVSVACCLGFVLIVVADDDYFSNAKIHELQSRKLELLEDIISRYRFGYSKGKPVLEELLSAEHELLNAKLDIANSLADRIKLHELIVENRGKLVEARIAGHKLGNNAEIEILAARVTYIDAKIALAQEGVNR